MESLSCIFVFLFFGAQVFAYNLKGRVTDKERKAVAFANVNILSEKDSSFLAGAMSDSLGNFNISGIKTKGFIIQVTCLGYKDYQAKVSLPEGQTIYPAIEMEASGVGLKEVVVNGRKRVFSMKNGILTTNVAGTVLGREHDITEVLRKIPGMSYDGKNLSVLGLGDPLIYIDGRKVSNKSELQDLIPENIATILLITNPGSEYDASTHAVVSIKTLKKGEGLMVETSGEGRYGRRFSDKEEINMSYRKKKLNLSVSYRYEDSKSLSYQNIWTSLQGDTIWNIRQYLHTFAPSDRTHHVEASVGYDCLAKTSLGLKYDGSFEKSLSNISENDTIYRNAELYTPSKINSKLNEHTEYNHINAFFTTSFSPELNYYFYGDYVHQENRRTQDVKEKPDSLEAQNIYIYNSSRSELYGADTYLEYKSGKAGQIKLGYNYTNTNVRGRLENVENIIPASDYENKEARHAIYVSMNYGFDKNFSLNAGLRYEHTNYVYRDKIGAVDINKSYNDLFPTTSLNYIFGGFSHSLSYTRRTVRPNYRNLNSRTAYSSRFSYQVGNPQLQPEKDDRIQYNLVYRSYYLSLAYVNKSDFIGSYLYTDPEKSSRYIFSWKNFHRLQQWSATLHGEEKIGLYNPSLSLFVSKNAFKVNVEGSVINYNKPICYIDWNNNLSLFKNWLLDLEYVYNAGGSYQIFTFSPNYTLGFSLKKSFFHKTLDVDIYGSDIFRTGINRYSGGVNNISFSQWESGDWRRFGLSVIYRFNNYKQTYKGKSAAEDEINRL